MVLVSITNVCIEGQYTTLMPRRHAEEVAGITPSRTLHVHLFRREVAVSLIGIALAFRIFDADPE
jgi:hypothetical protein